MQALLTFFCSSDAPRAALVKRFYFIFALGRFVVFLSNIALMVLVQRWIRRCSFWDRNLWSWNIRKKRKYIFCCFLYIWNLSCVESAIAALFKFNYLGGRSRKFLVPAKSLIMIVRRASLRRKIGYLHAELLSFLRHQDRKISAFLRPSFLI